MIQLDTIVLPDSLFWEDEFAWRSVGSSMEYSSTGAVLLDLDVKQAGRPITLTAEGDEYCWLKRSEVLALETLAADPGREMALTLDSRNYTVIFRPGDKPPFDAESIWREMPVADEDDYILKAVRLMTI